MENKEAVNNEIPYTPQMYEAYIDRLALELVSDLKSGVINEHVFADTYAKYQNLKIKNANRYQHLSEDVRKIVDEYSRIFLTDVEKKNRELTRRIVELELQIKCLKSENSSLISEVDRLKRLANPFSHPYDPWRRDNITYCALHKMAEESQEDE